ncbi:AlpA family transcriptional regulator [Tamaricihabitans halophyticus]|uniref:AlpA family transcriptional regulator n=1 Tax=Tamaricihabitans halophyticus TaxID=1262583 RepID=A0A4R2QF42_9PSEU|nr:helix-turn-helix domain-containing protein [Tamaricihabitans halophyticus]TCP47289.1 AlpA family transcriptional regulator [Tamaricihabitans halophyticus]
MLHNKERLWTINDLAEYLGIPRNTLYAWRAQGYGPKGVRMGKYVRYSPEDVDLWLAQMKASV